MSEKSTREAHNKHILVQQSSICVAKKKSLAAGCLAGSVVHSSFRGRRREGMKGFREHEVLKVVMIGEERT